MVKRYPHATTLFWLQPGTMNSVGVMSEGSTVSTVFSCNYQPEKFQFVRGDDGDSIKVSYTIYAPPLNTVFSASADVKVSFKGSVYKVLKAFQYQKHTEIQI